MFKKALSIVLSLATLVSCMAGTFSAFAEYDGTTATVTSNPIKLVADVGDLTKNETVGVKVADDNARTDITFGTKCVWEYNQSYECYKWNDSTKKNELVTVTGFNGEGSAAEAMKQAVGVENYTPIQATSDNFSISSYDPDTGVKTNHPIERVGNSVSVFKPEHYTDDRIARTPELVISNMRVDSDGDGELDSQKDGSYVEMVYDLGAIYDLSAMFFGQSDRQWLVGKYQVFVAKDSEAYANNKLEEIVNCNIWDYYKYNDTNHYDNQKIKRGSANHCFSFTKAIEARYVVLRINKISLYGPETAHSDNHISEIRTGQFSVQGVKKSEDNSPLILRGNTTTQTDEAVALNSTNANFAYGVYNGSAKDKKLTVGTEDIGFRSYAYDPDFGRSDALVSDTQKAALYDGNLTTKVAGDINKTHSGSVYGYNASTKTVKDGFYYDFVYELGDLYSINAIQLATIGDQWVTAAYEVYTAQNATEYFAGKLTKVVDYSILNEKYSDPKNSGSTAHSKQYVEFTTPITAQYVVLRVTAPTMYYYNQNISSSKDYKIVYRLSEYALYGEYLSEGSKYAPAATTNETDATANGETYQSYFDISRNLIADKLPVSEIYLDTENGVNTPKNLNVTTYDRCMNPTSTGKTLGTQSDGKRQEGGQFGGNLIDFGKYGADNKPTGEFYNDDTQKYYQFNYKLDGAAKISSFALQGHTSPSLSPKHIKVSFANTEAELFTDTAQTFDYDNLKTNFIMRDFTADNVVAKYFGLRVVCSINDGYSHGKGTGYVRLTRFGILGEYVTPAGDITASVNSGGAYKELAQTVGDPVVAEGAAKDWNGKYASGMVSQKLRAMLLHWVTDETNDDISYVFENWTSNATGEVLSTELEFNSTESATANYVHKYWVDFTDKTGNIIEKLFVKPGEKINAADVPAVPEVYGYTAIGWDSDTTAVVNSEMHIKPTYTRNTSLTGTLKLNGSDTDKVDYSFDQRITLADKSNEKHNWKVNDAAFAYNTDTIDVYAFGTEMNVKTEAPTEVTEKSVSILGHVKSGNDVIVFAHTVNYVDEETVPAAGFMLTNQSGYDAINQAGGIEKADMESLITNKKFTAYGFNVNSADFMGMIKLNASTSARYVYAYATEAQRDSNGQLTDYKLLISDAVKIR